MMRSVWFALLLGLVVAWPATGPSSERGLDAARRDVLIRRDTFGVPHIRAASLGEAAFGLGYAMAEDHAVELGRRYVAAEGRAAEVFGESEIEGDFAAARFDNLASARRALRTVAPAFRSWLDGFAAGFNHYVASHRAALPDWMPRIDAATLLAHGRSGSLASALRLPRDILRRYAPAGATDRDTARLVRVPHGFPPYNAVAEAGSNAFALSGSRTTSGRPILLGNPHLRWSSLYWEAHVTVPGVLDFYGSTLVGLPVLRAGFNRHLGYVQTNNAPDHTDILVVPLDPGRPGHYRFNGRPWPLRPRQVTVRVKAAQGPPREVSREAIDTHLGPVIHKDADRVFVVRSMTLDSWRYLEGFFDLAQSRSLADFRARLARGHLFMSNFTYADAAGNILYQWNGRVPRRVPNERGYDREVPADTDRWLWKDGLHAIGELPSLLNPPGGYVQNANNSPWWTSTRDRLDPDRHPPYIERGPLSLRAQLVLDMLDARERFSVDDVVALKYSNRSLLAERMVPALAEAGRAAPDLAEPARAGLALLERWDRTVAASSEGAALFIEFWEHYTRRAREPFARPWTADAPLETPAGLASPNEALEALGAAVETLRKDYGGEAVRFGDVMRFRAPGGVDLPGDGWVGALGTYRVMGYDKAPAEPGRYIAGYAGRDVPLAGVGDAWVLLVHFTEPLEAWSVLAYGQTTNPDSPHSRDQLPIFAAHRLRRVAYTGAQVREATVREYRP
ncbi:MAG: penicillin acylase family protein [Vicinamibacteraceae bacterium]|nr:penicillin acylase family protein [Vicinamibacteraceae bacterium]